MKRLLEQQFLIRKNLLFILGLCLSLYFSYHTLQGDRSLPHLMSLYKSIDTKNVALDVVKAEREALERHVVMLRPQSLNGDFLEERARLVLGISAADEMIIVQN